MYVQAQWLYSPEKTKETYLVSFSLASTLLYIYLFLYVLYQTVSPPTL